MARWGGFLIVVFFACSAPIWGQAPATPNYRDVTLPEQTDANAILELDLGHLGAAVGEERHTSRFWIQGEFLYWWTKNARIPALVTTGSFIDPRPGALDNPGTKVLLAGPLEYEERFGGRFTAGWWLDPDHATGVEGAYFFLGDKEFRARFMSDGQSVLARPFTDANNNLPDSSLVGFPGLVKGSIDITSSTRLDGFEVNLLRGGAKGESRRLHWLVGFRYLYLGEDLRIEENSQIDATSLRFPGNRVLVTDEFLSRNDIFGPQIGVKCSLSKEPLCLQFTGKVLLGASSQEVRMRGRTAIDTIPETVAPAGLLAVASNSGSHDSWRFAVVPEVGVNLNYQITSCVKAFVGYNFLYINQVARAGNQVNLAVHPHQIPTSATYGLSGPSPTFQLQNSDYWSHGLNVGLEWRF